MVFTKASMFIFFLVALVLCQQSIALRSSAKETQTDADNLHVVQHEERGVMVGEGSGQGTCCSYIQDDLPVLTSDSPPSDSLILVMIVMFFAVGGLLYDGGYYFMGVMLAIVLLFSAFFAANT